MTFETLEDRRLLTAIRNLAGFETYQLDRNDDASSELVETGFEMTFFGSAYDSLYVNNNGNMTFDAPLNDWQPISIASVSLPMIAPFWADVDTRNEDSGVVTYGLDAVDGHSAFGVNWIDVGYYEENADLTNSFQLVLIDRSDVQSGAFDIEFNYDRIVWETGDLNNGPNGLGLRRRGPGFPTGRRPPAPITNSSAREHHRDCSTIIPRRD